jgi:hypothetical protein
VHLGGPHGDPHLSPKIGKKKESQGHKVVLAMKILQEYTLRSPNTLAIGRAYICLCVPKVNLKWEK